MHIRRILWRGWIRRPALNTLLSKLEKPSAQGFLAVPLCGILEEARNIDEPCHLYMRGPQREPGNRYLAIPSDQPFAQSRVLADEGTDRTYKTDSSKRHKPANTTPKNPVRAVDAVRSWKILMRQGKGNALNADGENAFRDFSKALSLAENLPIAKLPKASHYRRLTLRELGSRNRRFGRYEKAKGYLEAALLDASPSLESVGISGELRAVYRHMNRLDDAKRAFQTQYDNAKELESERDICRAVGNLGMANYQLSQRVPHDDFLLAEAIKNQKKRIEKARQLQRKVQGKNVDSITRNHYKKQAMAWESIGLNRLSLYYTASGETKKAIEFCLESHRMNETATDATLVAFSRLFYGRALYRHGQRDAAMLQFNQAKPCSPAIALCKEPSQEHREYLQELVDAGVDMDLTDENGYTALEYAVFNNDEETEALVLKGLRRGLGEKGDVEIHELQHNARLRKAYRELFQERLRPVLLKNKSADSLQALRREYASSLAEDESKRKMFDAFKFIRYTDFQSYGEIPSWSSSALHTFRNDESDVDFVIFFSYRWLNEAKPPLSSDDEENTQYRRMIDATEEFLRLHPKVNRDKLGVWVGSQLNQLSSRGCLTRSRITRAFVRMTQCQASMHYP
ncbi:hypothetical protein AK830_g401 [Neonectria ditissima]|uniref:Uncharacterized protein n=1 Tax=Neonectria ditissima TaxID=78410 RepID=A0A0P7C297_9HYPO|nr:hypothetical protein AK830_g401 [Neonectria ditissima]